MEKSLPSQTYSNYWEPCQVLIFLVAKLYLVLKNRVVTSYLPIKNPFWFCTYWKFLLAQNSIEYTSFTVFCTCRKQWTLAYCGLSAPLTNGRQLWFYILGPHRSFWPWNNIRSKCDPERHSFDGTESSGVKISSAVWAAREHQNRGYIQKSSMYFICLYDFA